MTREWLLSRVDALVFVEAADLAEALVTLRTLVRLLARVSPHVRLHDFENAEG